MVTRRWLCSAASGRQLCKTNLVAWLERHGPTLKPPVANKLLYGASSELKVMVVGGPNARRDYHIQTGEEFFMQLKGELVLKVIEAGTFKDIVVREGESFLLPSHVPHSPQRSAGSIGLVFERSHTPEEMDGMLWFGSDTSHGQAVNFNAVEYEEYFHCVDLGVQLKPIIERYAQWCKSGAAPVRSADAPIKPDAEARCGAPKKCNLANFHERTLHERGDEILVNIDVGPSAVLSSASPFDFFVWQTRGTSTCRVWDGPARRLDMGDVGLIEKGTPYECQLEPSASLLTVANVYT